MIVLIDTCIWSGALRRKSAQQDVELERLIDDDRVGLIGPIRQETLCGLREKDRFELIREYLAVFRDLEIVTGDYVRAAEFFNLCRSNGIQGTNTDFLLCAVSVRMQIPIYTVDRDFNLYASLIPITFHRPGS